MTYDILYICILVYVAKSCNHRAIEYVSVWLLVGSKLHRTRTHHSWIYDGHIYNYIDGITFHQQTQLGCAFPKVPSNSIPTSIEIHGNFLNQLVTRPGKR